MPLDRRLAESESEQMRYVTIVAALVVALVGPAEAAMHHATGSFEVTMTPSPGEPAWLQRMTMTKTYTGSLAATAHGEFTAAGDFKSGSAGYIAAERVDGTLGGHIGTFVIMQSATLDRGKPEMRVFVVPGSGTGALTGITGTMAIRIEAGRHFYDLDYDLAP